MLKVMLRRGSFYLAAGVLFLLFSLAAAVPQAAAAEPYRWLGGIRGDVEYAEMLYLTGEPVLLKGTLRQSSGRSRDGSSTANLTYTLENKEKGIKLTRTISFTTTSQTNGKQEVATTALERFRETIRIGSDRYNLEDFQFSRSDLIDHQPGVDYVSGNWSCRKVYSVNNGLAEVILESGGHNVGYSHAWGSTETAREEGTVSFSGQVALDRDTLLPAEWSCSYSQATSYSRSRYLEYQANEPLSISFSGGYVANTVNSEVLSYQGSFPDLEDGVPDSDRWLRRQGSYELKTLPVKERLPVANLFDVSGHWAEADIRILYGLGAFGDAGDYFHPTAYLLRGQFARALVAVLDLPLPGAEARQAGGNNNLSRRQARQQQAEETQSLFADVPLSDPAYPYYRAVAEAGVMGGVAPGTFGAARTITRAEALAILVRALGLEGLAPAGLPATPFYDDFAIPAWARQAVYVAYKIGLERGDDYGYLKPNETLTRAEAAVLLNRFIRYLQQEMTADYRERVLSYY
ncbi:MAG: S-layer homology domain-containing protein [Clostridia bacterium]|nr:S-layer homology domain-containing protein [Clostridia bacterium]